MLALAAALPAATFDEWAARAKAAREAGRYEEAITAYRQALAEKPDWPEGRWFYAVSFYEAKQFAPALEAFEAVTQSAPDTGAAWILLGLCEYELARYKPALQHLTRGRALGAHPDLLATAGYHLALLMNYYGESEAAVQLLVPFAGKDNQSPTVINAFGLAILRRPYLPHAIPNGEAEKIALAGRAAFLLAAKRAGEGRREMEKLVERYPGDLDVRYAYGAMLIEADPDAAMEQFRKVLAENPADFHANRMLGSLLSKRRQFDEALRLLENARRLRPHSVPARYQIAITRLAAGDLEQARTLLEQIVVEANEFTAAHVSLATVYYRLGRKQDGDRQRAIVRELTAQGRSSEPDAGGLSKSADSVEAQR
jgi:tetratricopeptide (TPR) repeat protein